MTNTHKKRKTNKHSSTKKMCPIGLKSFEEEFGIRLVMDEMQLGIERIEIVDEQKYLLFILKYQ